MKNNLLLNNSKKILQQIDFLPCFTVLIENDCELSDFIKTKNLQNFDVISESKTLLKGQYVVLKQRKYIIHIVKPNQTLQEIASIYNILPESILKNNNLSNIFVGQQLKIF